MDADDEAHDHEFDNIFNDHNIYICEECINSNEIRYCSSLIFYDDNNGENNFWCEYLSYMQPLFLAKEWQILGVLHWIGKRATTERNIYSEFSELDNLIKLFRYLDLLTTMSKLRQLEFMNLMKNKSNKFSTPTMSKIKLYTTKESENLLCL